MTLNTIVRAMVLGLVGFGLTASAQESENEGTNQVVIPQSEVVEKDSGAPEEITNAKLKAKVGSKSKYSFKISASFDGPSVRDLTSKYRPNPEGLDPAPETEAAGSVAAKYRVNSQSTIGVGTGITLVAPFQDGVDRREVSNPYLNYAYAYKVGDWQHNSVVTLTKYTKKRYVDIGFNNAISYTHYVVRPLGKTKWNIGADGGVSFINHTRAQEDLGANVYMWGWGSDIFAEYAFTDRTNMNVAYTMGGTHFARDKKYMEFDWDEPRSSIGLGHSFTDTIYVSPSLTFFPERPSIETTTLAVSAIMSFL